MINENILISHLILRIVTKMVRLVTRLFWIVTRMIRIVTKIQRWLKYMSG